MQVRDRSLSNSGGELTGNRGSVAIHPTPGGESQEPRIPSERSYTEVSSVVGDVESCPADVADMGGHEGNGNVNSATDVSKSHGVATHPGLNRAHQMSSVSHADHCAVHGAADKCDPMAKPGSGLPEGGSGMAEVTGEPESTVAVAPSSAGSTMPAGHGGLEVAKGPVVAKLQGNSIAQSRDHGVTAHLEHGYVAKAINPNAPITATPEIIPHTFAGSARGTEPKGDQSFVKGLTARVINGLNTTRESRVEQV